MWTAFLEKWKMFYLQRMGQFQNKLYVLEMKYHKSWCAYQSRLLNTFGNIVSHSSMLNSTKLQSFTQATFLHITFLYLIFPFNVQRKFCFQYIKNKNIKNLLQSFRNKLKALVKFPLSIQGLIGEALCTLWFLSRQAYIMEKIDCPENPLDLNVFWHTQTE